MHYSTKNYGNERGLSCSFRQWRATSHCRLVHGYSLGFRFVFAAQELNDKNWVYDFGRCGWIKEFLENNFDHTLAIAKDDPHLEDFRNLHNKGICRLVEMDHVGCEKFAEYVYNWVNDRLKNMTGDRVYLHKVEVYEHGSNSAIYGV